MTKMFNYAKDLTRTICHDYYQETCVVLMFLTLLVTIACLLATLTQGTKTPGDDAAQTLRAEQRHHQAWVSGAKVARMSPAQQRIPYGH